MNSSFEGMNEEFEWLVQVKSEFNEDLLIDLCINRLFLGWRRIFLKLKCLYMNE